MDELTVEAARRGDRSAQAGLLRQLQDRWFRFTVGILGNADDAQDAVQETALRFLRDLPRFRGGSSITTWSMGIALNVTREIRRKARKPMAITPELAQSADQAVIEEDAREMLRETLLDLPERQREAIVLRFFEELSIEETAVAMDCAAGTVKATIFQALRTLKGKLKALT